MTIEVMKCFLSVSSFSLLWNDKDDLIFLLIILIRFCITMIDERLQILLHEIQVKWDFLQFRLYS